MFARLIILSNYPPSEPPFPSKLLKKKKKEKKKIKRKVSVLDNRQLYASRQVTKKKKACPACTMENV